MNRRRHRQLLKLAEGEDSVASHPCTVYQLTYRTSESLNPRNRRESPGAGTKQGQLIHGLFSSHESLERWRLQLFSAHRVRSTTKDLPWYPGAFFDVRRYRRRTPKSR
jgi:hypothetical protein